MLENLFGILKTVLIFKCRLCKYYCLWCTKSVMFMCHLGLWPGL